MFQKYRAPEAPQDGLLAGGLVQAPDGTLYGDSPAGGPSPGGAGGAPPGGGLQAGAFPAGHLVHPAAPGLPPPSAEATATLRVKSLLKTQWTFSQEELLRDTLTTFGNNAVAFLLIAMSVLLPEVALSRYVLAQLAVDPALALWGLAAALAGSLLIMPIVTAAFVYGVLQEMRGLRPSVLACLWNGVRSLLRVLLVSIFQGIAVFAGGLLCILPGIFLFTMFYLAVPAAVEERLGPLSALGRSAALTRDYRLSILWVLGKLFFFQAVLNIAVRFVLSLGDAPEWLFTGFSFFITTLSAALGATATAVTYYRVRMAKEGVDAAELVSVFD